jgi:hypothetical protein
MTASITPDTSARPGPALNCFDEDNCHKQCSACNNHLSGNLTAYRPALIAKIGQARFDALMGRTHYRNGPGMTISGSATNTGRSSAT